MQDRNINKFMISIDEIEHNILNQFNIYNADISQVKVKNTDKQRAVFKICCDKGTYCLKKVYYCKEDLLFIYSVVEWIYRNGINTARFIKSVNNTRYVEYKDMLFILTPWIDGQKFDYDCHNNIIKAAHFLGNFHNVTKNFFPIDGSSTRYNYSNLYSSLYKHMSQLKQCCIRAQQINDEYSNIFLDYYETYMNIGEKCLEISSNINDDELSRSVCHGDYVNKNIIINENKELCIIDFDKSAFNFCADDIAYFLRRVLKRENTKWDINLAETFLQEYNTFNKLNADDIAYILSYVLFPQKYWRLSRDYYNNLNKANKKSFCNLLRKSTQQAELHRNFMKLIISDFNL